MVMGDIVKNILIRINTVINENSRANFKEISEDTKKMTENFSRVTRITRSQTAENIKSTKQYRAFRFELLSVMFVSKQVSQTMFGLLQPALAISGIFEIISTILEVFFLPIALLLLDPLLSLMDWFLDMPEPIQELIGGIVLVIGVIATILLAFANFGMMLSSYGLTFKTFISLVTTFGANLLGLIIPVISTIITTVGGLPLALLAIISVLIIAILFNIEGFVNSFKKFFENMVYSVGRIFGGIKQVFEGIWDTIIGVFTGNQELVDSGLRKMIDGIIDFVGGAFDTLIGNFGALGYDLIIATATGIKNAYTFIKSAIQNIPIIGPLLSGGLSFVENIGGGIVNTISSGIKGIASLFNIPGFASGGIVTKPTFAMVGEAGPEAIIPLDKVNNNNNNGSVYYQPIYNINNDINSRLDVDYMLNEIERRQASDYARLRLL